MGEETIERRRGDIETAKALSALETQLEHIAGAVERIEGALNGKDGKDGMLTRVALLEQANKRRDWLHGLWASGLVAYLFRWLSELRP